MLTSNWQKVTLHDSIFSSILGVATNWSLRKTTANFWGKIFDTKYRNEFQKIYKKRTQIVNINLIFLIYVWFEWFLVSVFVVTNLLVLL